ncbi:MAG: PQQ-dependent sugar dehydrogenase, partial [Nocardioides sp.]
MTARTSRAGVGAVLVALAGGLLAVLTAPAPQAQAQTQVALHEGHPAPILPSEFQDRDAIDSLSEPTAVAFAPDGTAFIALKSGEIKSFDYDAAGREFEPFATHTIFANLHVNVNNYWDRGLTGIAVDPQLGTAGHNWVYVNYTYNRDPRDNPPVVPKWDSGEGSYDGCLSPAAMPDPPQPAVDGCVVTTRVSRIPAVEQADGWVAAGPEQPLHEAGCMQFPSHASGDVRIGPDGLLYASTGEGASFDVEDFGQAGNPCGDPANEGGSLRSQDYRTGDDPLGLGGTVWRINPTTGAAPNGSNSNAARLVLYGQRNPWRFTFRPGTSELWSSDVGGSAWEEINRTDMATFGGPANLGWPCYEGKVGGAVRQPTWDLLDKPVCENLYALGAGAIQAPAFAYQTRGPVLTPGEHCESTTSSVSGVAFAQTSSNYPAEYQGSLFFSDFARACIWRLGKLPNGDPEPATVIPFVQNASTPVSLVPGPDGDLFYVDYGIVDGVVTPQAGAIHRITYQDPAPVAAISANRISGPLRKTYRFSAVGTKDPHQSPLTYSWDLDGNGSFETGTGSSPRASRRYASKTNVSVSVRATNAVGRSDTASLTVYPGNHAPVLHTVTPSRKLTWEVGQKIRFLAKARDQDQKLRSAAYTWSLSIRHCPKACHTHPIDQWPGTRKGSFRAPDHEYPSHLLLDVAVTDARGLSVHKTVRIDPMAVKLTFATQPARLRLAAGGVVAKAPFSRRFIVAGHLIASAPEVQRRQGVTYRFRRWSDGGDRSHDIVAPQQAMTLTAAYQPVKAQLRVRTSPTGLAVQVGGER